MAEGTITVKSSGVNTAADGTPAAASVDGDKFLNDGETMLALTVGSTDCTLTVVSVPCSHGRTGDLTFACTVDGDTYLLGPFPPSLFNDTNGYCHVTYSAVTAVKIAAIRKSS